MQNFGFKYVFKREIKRMGERPLYLLIGLVFPLLSFMFFWSLFSDGVPKELPVVIFDKSNSMLSNKAIRMIDATESIKVVNEVSNFIKGKEYLERGEAYSLIVIPKGLDLKALNGEIPKIVNYYNNEYMVVGSIIDKNIRRVVGTISAGINLGSLQKKGEMRTEAIAHLEPIVLQYKAMFNPYTNYQYFFTGIVNPTMLQLFVILLTIYALGIEFKEKTIADWLKAANGEILTAIFGKIAPYTILFIIISFFMNSFHFHIIGAPQRGSFVLISIGTIFLILASQAIALLFISLTVNTRMSLSLAAIHSGTAFAFIGLTFPAIGMPMFAKLWSLTLPLTYFTEIFIDQSMKGLNISSSFNDILVLSLFILILPIPALFRMKEIMSDSKYWGRE